MIDKKTKINAATLVMSLLISTCALAQGNNDFENGLKGWLSKGKVERRFLFTLEQ
jgi:hypothetical protein